MLDVFGMNCVLCFYAAFSRSLFSEYGGLGLDFSYSVAVAEELGNINCGAIPMAIGVQLDMATPALTRYDIPKIALTFDLVLL